MNLKKIIAFSLLFMFPFVLAQNKESNQAQSQGHEALDVVTHVKPIQQIIIEYMGQFDYIEDPSKLISAETFAMIKWPDSFINRMRLTGNGSTVQFYDKNFPEDKSGIRFDNLNNPPSFSPHKLEKNGDWMVHVEWRQGRQPTKFKICNSSKRYREFVFENIRSYAYASISPDGSKLAIVYPNGKKTAILDIRDCTTKQVQLLHSKTILWNDACNAGVTVRYSFDGKYLAYLMPEAIEIMDGKTFQYITSISTKKEASKFNFSLDGKYLAYGNRDLLHCLCRKKNPLLKQDE